jgi:hypothetical protein
VFSELIYIFEFLIETHRSNRYAGKLSGFCFERDFPRLTEERYSVSLLGKVQSSWLSASALTLESARYSKLILLKLSI